MFLLHERISVDRNLATIRYVGPVDAWGPHVTALGIEWDERSRGKHSGSLDGVEYFKTSVSGAGSFIKASNKKIEQRCTFVEALVRQYAGEMNEKVLENVILFGSKVAQNYGFHEHNKLQANFANLRSVGLERQNIYRSFDGLEEVKDLGNVALLDLSYNLFSSLNEVWHIVDAIGGLKSLNLNGNRFNEESGGFEAKHCLSSLLLASTNIAFGTVTTHIMAKFPELRRLSLAGNGYRAQNLGVSVPENVIETLDLSFNVLEAFPSSIRHFSCLKSLNIADNAISMFPDGQVYPEICDLDLRNNKIADLAVLDSIYLSFPNLRELRVNGNPVFDDMSVDEMTIHIIARFECADAKEPSLKLLKVNGSPLTKEEIRNGELYFISKVRKNEYVYDRSSLRWQTLLRKHQIEADEVSVPAKGNQLSRKKLVLNIRKGEDLLLRRTFLVDNSVLRLKGVVSRTTGDSVLDFQLFFFLNEGEKEGPKIKQYIDNELAVLDYYGLEQGQNVYVERCEI